MTQTVAKLRGAFSYESKQSTEIITWKKSPKYFLKYSQKILLYVLESLESGWNLTLTQKNLFSI